LILSLFEPGSRAIRVRSNVPGSILSMRNDSTDNGHLSVAEAIPEKLNRSHATTSPSRQSRCSFIIAQVDSHVVTICWINAVTHITLWRDGLKPLRMQKGEFNFSVEHF
jgi:hypothetical protein